MSKNKPLFFRTYPVCGIELLAKENGLQHPNMILTCRTNLEPVLSTDPPLPY
jgi:hypothetical protein